jgi:hypothetical protein
MRRAVGHLSRDVNPKCTRWSSPLADDGVPVTVTCRLLGFTTQASYEWRKSPSDIA